MDKDFFDIGMDIMDNIANIKEVCTGCENCAHICPVNAIKMRKMDHGFLYPVVNTEVCMWKMQVGMFTCKREGDNRARDPW